MGNSSSDVSLNLLAWDRSYRGSAFPRFAEMYSCRTVATSAVAGTMPVAAAGLDVRQLLGQVDLSAFILSVDGDVRVEHYGEDLTSDQLWPTFSINKSIVSTLIGIAISRNEIGSVDDEVQEYLPSVRRTALDGVTIRNLLRMSSGLAWDEDQIERSVDVQFLVDTWANGNCGALLPFIASHPRQSSPGAHFNYSSGDSHILTEVLAAAVGEDLTSYLSERLWRPLGMERDAQWMLDGPDGSESGSILMCARDLHRFGIATLDAHLGRRDDLIPTAWIREATSRSAPDGERYGYCWWIPEDGVYEAQGAYGQLLHVNVATRLVAVALSARSAEFADQQLSAMHRYLHEFARIL